MCLCSRGTKKKLEKPLLTCRIKKSRAVVRLIANPGTGNHTYTTAGNPSLTIIHTQSQEYCCVPLQSKVAPPSLGHYIPIARMDENGVRPDYFASGASKSPKTRSLSLPKKERRPSSPPPMEVGRVPPPLPERGLWWPLLLATADGGARSRSGEGGWAPSS